MSSCNGEIDYMIQQTGVTPICYRLKVLQTGPAHMYFIFLDFNFGQRHNSILNIEI